MLSGEHLAVLIAGIKRHNKTSNAPTSLVVTGDFCQLPPVDGDFAFDSKEWGKFETNTIELKGTHRQADSEFIEALRLCRRGDGKKALEYFRPMIHRSIDNSLGATTLFYKNIDVSKHNKKQMSNLIGSEIKFHTKRNGKQIKDWARSKIPEIIKLRRGCQVMVLANSYGTSEDNGRRVLVYANGELGEFLEKDDHNALVRLHRSKEVVSIAPVIREAKGYGSIEYMPLRAAYASTIHKIQGLSLDSLQVVITDPNFNLTPGLLYVALSRAKTAAGIRIVGTPNLFVERCKTDKRVERWL
jgi:hypothetical protein